MILFVLHPKRYIHKNNFNFIKIKVDKFQKIKLIIPAKADPLMPNLGINATFKATFISEAMAMIFLNCFSWPVMFMNSPVEPDIAFIN